MVFVFRLWVNDLHHPFTLQDFGIPVRRILQTVGQIESLSTTIVISMRDINGRFLRMR